MHDPRYNALNLMMQCEQSLGAYMAREASDATAIAQNHNTVLRFGQPIDSTAAQSSIDRLIDAKF